MTTTLKQNNADSDTFQAERVLPLTESQRGFWAQGALGPGAFRAYNVARTVKLTGSYDHTALQRAVRALMERHEALRTRIEADGESQVIAPWAAIDVPLVDLSHLPESDREAQARQLLAESAAQLFDPLQASWIRGLTVRLAEECHFLTLTAHHAIANGPSFRIMLAELFALYQGQTVLPAPMQLTEFVRTQPELARAQDEAFWLAQFAKVPPRLDLPLDRPRPRLRSFQGNRMVDRVEAETVSALRKVGAAWNGSLYTVLLGTFALLMRRLSGQEDVVVGATFESGIRQLEGGQALVANTTNVLPLRFGETADMPWGEYLRHTGRLVESAAAHKEWFFGRLLSKLDMPHDLTQPPLFSVLFNFYGGEFRSDAGSVRVELLKGDFPYSAPQGTAMFDFALDVAKDGDGLELHWDYATALFEPATIQRWLGYYRRLLEGIAADPEARLSELPLLVEAEREQLLGGWNNTARAYPSAGTTLHRLIEAQVERTPKALAVSFEGQSLTYGELNARANRLAHRLREQGVGPDALVAVLAERSLELVIGLVAVLKAGGAYLPLDPGQPAPRRALMLQDAKPVVVLAQRALLDLVPTGNVLVLEEDPAAAPSDNPVGGASPDHLAYVIYTSGSTGVPKGVMNTHAGICNFVCWLQEAFQLGPNDCILLKTAFTFDVSLAEIFGALTTGARLVVARPGLHGDTAYLAEAVAQEGVTALWFVTPVLAAFLYEPGLLRGGSLRHVTTGGEPLTVDIVNHFGRVLPHAQLHNFYGPTETVVAVTAWACRPGDEDRSVPIGHPIANTQAYVLDGAQHLVPVGVTGELYIGGVQVGRGYLNGPELTAQMFVANPFGDGHLYRSGDRCRYRPDGALEYAGRTDQQVKLRGFRIELGEIESVLEQHPAVRGAVAAVTGSAAGEPRLVAYVAGDPAVLYDELLRDFTRIRLPEYMVPSAWVILPEFPLTPNGKVDRRALPEPASAAASVIVPPRTALETRLAAIWEKVLKVQPVGVTANFFELGGSSLAAVRVFAEIKNDFGKNLPIASLFTRPTVEALAGLLKEEVPEQEWTPIVAIHLRGSRPPFFGIHAGLGNVLFYRELAQLLGKEQPFYGIQSQGLDGKPIARTSVETIADYYWQEVRKVQPHGPYLLGGYSFGGVVAYEMARLVRAAGEEVALLALFDTGNPARPPRLRSYAERLHNAFQNREAFSPHRIMHFLAGRTRGELGDRLLRWSETYRTVLVQFRQGDDEAAAEERVDLTVITTHERAALAYRPLPYEGKLTLLRARTQEKGYITEPDLGWGTLVREGVEVHDVPGTHYSLFSDENVGALAKVLNGCIQASLAGRRVTAAPRPQRLKRTSPLPVRETVSLAFQEKQS